MQLFESINLVFVPFLSRQFSDKRNKSLQVIDLHKVQGIPKIQLIGTTRIHTQNPFYNGAAEIREQYMRIYGFDYKKACCYPTDFDYEKLD